MKTRLRLAAMVLLASSMPLPANAAVITYDFTAIVQKIYTWNGGSIVNVTSSNLPGSLFSIGNTMHGRFSYSTNTAVSPYYQPPQPLGGSEIIYSDATSANTTSLTFDQNGWQYQSGPFMPTIQIQDNGMFGWDTFSLTTNALYSPLTFQDTTINLFDSSGKAFSSGAIPASLSLAEFSSTNIDFAWLRQSDGHQMHAAGPLTSLTLEAPSAVPEPATIALLGVGLFGLGATRRRATAKS